MPYPPGTGRLVVLSALSWRALSRSTGRFSAGPGGGGTGLSPNACGTACAAAMAAITHCIASRREGRPVTPFTEIETGLLSVGSLILEVSFPGLVDDVVAGAPTEGHDGEGGIFVGVGGE